MNETIAAPRQRLGNVCSADGVTSDEVAHQGAGVSSQTTTSCSTTMQPATIFASWHGDRRSDGLDNPTGSPSSTGGDANARNANNKDHQRFRARLGPANPGPRARFASGQLRHQGAHSLAFCMSKRIRCSPCGARAFNDEIRCFSRNVIDRRFFQSRVTDAGPAHFTTVTFRPRCGTARRRRPATG